MPSMAPVWLVNLISLGATVKFLISLLIPFSFFVYYTNCCHLFLYFNFASQIRTFHSLKWPFQLITLLTCLSTQRQSWNTLWSQPHQWLVCLETSLHFVWVPQTHGKVYINDHCHCGHYSYAPQFTHWKQHLLIYPVNTYFQTAPILQLPLPFVFSKQFSTHMELDILHVKGQ